MNNLSAVLSAISHPSRRAIIAQLANGPARVTEIAEPFEMSLNAVSKHLKVLEEAGLVHRQKQGRDHVIEFRGEPLRQVAGWVHEYERFWNEHLDKLEAHFIEKRKQKT
ncbi:MAG TPA: metalloregulator ArsR/SmtB family transcription factor, partial [Verrucomicrobiae bacterium]|nr:metalloregulator ArsR/SmtB family transcription factor [Verrucomicrobiae bacterium]